MPLRLRVGIIGLGRTWQRYQPVLRRLRELFDVRCVYDPRPHRVETVARELGCSGAAGAIDLLDRPEVEALLLLDRAWFGLWPVAQACRFKKPVYCAPSLVPDGAHADDLHAKVATSDTLVLMALPPTATQAVVGLRELLARRLGPVRLVRCDWVVPRGKKSGTAVDGLGSPKVLSLLWQCADFFGVAPVAVHTTAANGAGFASVFLDFDGGRVGQVSVWAGTRSACRVQVVAEKGTGEAELPNDVRWQDRAGWHLQRLPNLSPRQRLLNRFFVAVRNGEKAASDFGGTYRALTWQRAALRSLAEGKRVVIGG